MAGLQWEYRLLCMKLVQVVGQQLWYIMTYTVAEIVTVTIGVTARASGA